MAEIVYETASGELASIWIDATEREVHTSSALVTEHPVERGANVSDHTRPELDRLRLECRISNSPISVPGSHLEGVTGTVEGADLDVRALRRRAGPPKLDSSGSPPQLLPGGRLAPGVAPVWSASPEVETGGAPARANVLQFSGEFDRVRAVYDELRTLSSEGTLVRILTGLRDYDNMVLKSIEAPREAASGSIAFSIEAVQVRIVDSETVAAPEPVEPRARPLANEGNVPAVPVPAVDNASFAARYTGYGASVP